MVVFGGGLAEKGWESSNRSSFVNAVCITAPPAVPVSPLVIASADFDVALENSPWRSIWSYRSFTNVSSSLMMRCSSARLYLIKLFWELRSCFSARSRADMPF
eukprot:6492597-Amphidinium_carterae.5